MGAMMQIKPIHTVVALFSKSVVHLAPCQEVTSHLNPGMYVGASLSGHKNTPYIDDMLPSEFTKAMATARFCAGLSIVFATHMSVRGDRP